MDKRFVADVLRQEILDPLGDPRPSYLLMSGRTEGKKLFTIHARYAVPDATGMETDWPHWFLERMELNSEGDEARLILSVYRPLADVVDLLKDGDTYYPRQTSEAFLKCLEKQGAAIQAVA